jgi:hypothetical protein
MSIKEQTAVHSKWWEVPSVVVAAISIVSAILAIGLSWGIASSKLEALSEKVTKIETSYASDEQLETIKVLIQGLDNTINVRLKSLEDTVKRSK